jgi:cytochrome c-type biogenesis protein CcmH/NrfG
MKRALVLALSLFSTLSVFAATAADHAAAGRAAMERNQVEAAVAAFEKAVALSPKDAELHYLLGSAVGRQAQKANPLKMPALAKKAKASLDRAVQLDPRHFNARFALITYYLAAPGFLGGGEDKALAEAAEMKKLDTMMGHRAYARVYRAQKKPELARKEMVEAVREQPNSAAAHYYLGNAWFAEKKYAQALHEYEYALKLDATYMPALFRLGVLAAETNSDHARGEASLKKYLTYKPAEDEPAVASAWYYLGKIYENQGRKADAKQSYLNAQKLVPDDANIKAALKRMS